MPKHERHRVHLRSKDRAYFTMNLALLLKAAVPIGDIFVALQETSPSRKFRRALDHMKHNAEEGMSLWKVLDDTGVVPAQTVALIKLGEESGNLVRNLEIAAKQEEKQRMLRAKIGSALLYPAFVFGITIIVGLGVAWFLLPRLADTFSQLHVTLPLISQIVINLGKYLGDNGYWLVPAIILGLLALGYILFGAPKTRWLGQRLIFHLPGIGRLVREVEIARFGYLFGILLNAGLPVTQSLQLMEEAATSPYYKKLYRYLFEAFDNGESLNTSLKKYHGVSKILPASVQQMIIAGERSGSLPDALLNVGDVYEAKSSITTQNLESILEPVLLLIVWLGVLIVAVAVILPIYSLVGGLQ